MSLSLNALVNHQVRLAARPVGLPQASDWQHTTEAVAEPAEGGVLVKTLALSLDPAMRGWMNEGKSYIPPVGIGEVMRAGGVGVVVASRNAGFAVGDTVSGGPGVQEYWSVAAEQVQRSGLVKIDLRAGSLTQWLNVLGMPGMTGYFGLMDVGQPQAGETVVVSGAAGAVGQTVGQLAKLKGCRVVGIAGGAAKCEWVVNELGFDACIDYKGGSVKDGLKQHCPQGVDVYFDNVGDEILDTVLNDFGCLRVTKGLLPGMVAQDCISKPVRIATRLGITGWVSRVRSCTRCCPRMAQIGMNASFRMFPDSSAAKGDKSTKPQLSAGAVALQQMMRSVHF